MSLDRKLIERSSVRDNAGRLIFKTFNALVDTPTIQEIWLDLQKRSEHSYFNSWGWVSIWLASLPTTTEIHLHVAYLADIPIAAFFLGQHKKKRYRFFHSRTFSLNATAIPYYDSVYIEYNTVLYDLSMGSYFTNILEYLISLDWDELVFDGISQKLDSNLQLLSENKRLNYYILVKQEASSFFVDLSKIREADMNFLQLLSSNRRSQMRRSLKQYEVDGKIQIQESSSIESALIMFDELVRLHQLKWNKRGWGGAFSNQYLYQFHKKLIRERFETGEIQLLHIHTHKLEIGYIYCFVYNGEVLFYQSGFNYLLENNYRPGLVAHYLAILHNAEKNMKSYDFLAGDSPYKRSFSSDSSSMFWLQLYKKRYRHLIEEKILSVKKKIESTPALMRFLANIYRSKDK